MKPPAKLPPSFFSDIAAREALFKAGGDALYTALASWDGGRHAQRDRDRERELPKEGKDGRTHTRFREAGDRAERENGLHELTLSDARESLRRAAPRRN